MPQEKIKQMQAAHQVVYEFPFEIKELKRGYADRIMRIDLDKNEITILPVTQQMKDLWVGGKGFDLWLMFREIDKDTKWDSPENPLCFSPGPLGGTTSFPGSGKTLVTGISPITQSIMDCNVGGFFGPYFKFAGFDSLVIIGKAKEETIVVIDVVKKTVTIEQAPLESIDSHLLAEELTEMYADNDIDKRNIAAVSAGRAAEHSRMGVLNFSFWDWRRKVTRLKQAGRGGMGTVFRNKKLKALVVKNRGIGPAWRVSESNAAKNVTPQRISTQCPAEAAELDAIIEKWDYDPEFVTEMMQDMQERFRHISKTAIDRLQDKTGVPRAYIYHIATSYNDFSLEEKEAGPQSSDSAAQEIKSLPGKELVVFRNKGHLDPEEIEDYIKRGGYESFKKIVAENNPEAIVEEVIRSGLRGRGGGGFPTGVKWQAGSQAKKEQDEVIYVVCNAAGDIIEKSIIENDPHALIEGMLIGAFAAGADEGFIYIRKTHTAAIDRLEKAMAAARRKGLLGGNILDSEFSFHITLHRGSDAFIAAESSAMLAAMSGLPAEPQAKYIHTTEKGFRGKPTIVDNVETWVNIPVIFEKGADWFASIGSGDVSKNPLHGSSGTRVFSLTGDVEKPGLLEVPLGTTLKEIIEDIGGGVSNGGSLKAVQIGGPSGGFVPASQIDMKVDFESLGKVGGMMGSGEIFVLAGSACIVEKTRGFLAYLAAESCGKCTPCREGLFALKNTLQRICGGSGKTGDLEFLEEVSETTAETSLCDLGGTAPNPVLTGLRYFKDEFEEHIEEKKCRAGVCKFNAEEVK
ncbi:MAG: SLBB domain-containing protein [Candidatus Aminicenantes bacterium]|nr:SLBB domain-containing protein [Candidatus Aminicenantes bacterium]